MANLIGDNNNDLGTAQMKGILFSQMDQQNPELAMLLRQMDGSTAREQS